MKSIRVQITIFTAVRTVLNTAHRMIYPFLAVFARGLGVDVTTLSILLTARSFSGLISPFTASAADHRGRRFGMLMGIAVFTAAVALVAVSPSLLTLGIALLGAMLGKYLYEPAMQAYLGDRIPYQRRGLALAVTEMAWSLAFIGGIPLMGLLIAAYGWSAPFPVLAGLGLGMFAVIWWLVPHQDQHHAPAASPWTNLGVVVRNIPALAGVSIALWASAANELVNLIFGVWLEDNFGLKIAALGAASAIIGISELGGEGLVATFTDRLGKPRALALGLAGNIAAAALLPFIGRTEWGALAGLFLFYITFEFVVVSHVPLMTEVIPEARATVMAFNVAGHSIGRAVGALSAAFLYQSFGFAAVAGLAVVFNLFGLLALRRMGRSRG